MQLMSTQKLKVNRAKHGKLGTLTKEEEREEIYMNNSKLLSVCRLFIHSPIVSSPRIYSAPKERELANRNT